MMTGNINDFAGNGKPGYGGDGGPPTSARITTPTGVATDDVGGNVYISDTNNAVVRRVDNATRIITTFAGNGIEGDTGDNGPATKAELQNPTGLGVDTLGTVYIADTNNSQIRQVSGGTIRRLAGTGATGFSGDLGLATQAKLSKPTGTVAVGGTDVYFGDSGNNRVRIVTSGSPPVLGETELIILLPIATFLLGGAAFLVVRRRRRQHLAAAV
jgi:hypothetical protein